MIKWIGVFIGYLYFGFKGAIAVYFISALAERFLSGRTTTSKRGGFQQMRSEKFELNLLALSAIVIKADGAIDRKEAEFVRNYFIANYGRERASLIFSKFNEIKNETQNLTEISSLFVRNTHYETRLQILHFLFGIANSDGMVSPIEIEKLNEISGLLSLQRLDFESIKAMFVKQTGNAYKILEIDSHATDDEIKKAYRIMAKKYHPDKIITDDPAIKKGAQEKFQAIQEAYETIKRQRAI